LKKDTELMKNTTDSEKLCHSATQITTPTEEELKTSSKHRQKTTTPQVTTPNYYTETPITTPNYYTPTPRQ